MFYLKKNLKITLQCIKLLLFHKKKLCLELDSPSLINSLAMLREQASLQFCPSVLIWDSMTVYDNSHTSPQHGAANPMNVKACLPFPSL